MLFYFLYMFFLLFHTFPFRFPWFLYCRLYIFMYTTLFYNKISSPLRLVPRSHSGPLAFVHIRPTHFGATSSAPLSCLEPVSQPSRTLTPATAVVLFCFGHGQRCASASTSSFREFVVKYSITRRSPKHRTPNLQEIRTVESFSMTVCSNTHRDLLMSSLLERYHSVKVFSAGDTPDESGCRACESKREGDIVGHCRC